MKTFARSFFLFITYSFISEIFMEELLINLEKFIFGTPLMMLLLFTHIYFTVRLKFPQKKIFSALSKELHGERKKGEITPIKSLMTVLAGTLGTGNIIGIASAIIIGGVGSLFWIFLSGILAAATKYAETYIVLKYRVRKGKKYIGGASYILDEVMDKRILALIFSIFLILSTLTMGAMMQSNSITSTLQNNLKIDNRITGIIITLFAGYIVFGNEKRIAKASSIMVPLATIIYIACCAVLMFILRNNLSYAVLLIIKEAFNIKSLAGGIVGSSVLTALREGLNKGLFTNEAGIGTSPLFDVNVETDDISKQSLISASSVFIDTVILCSITGIIFVASGMYVNITDPNLLSYEVFSIIPFGSRMLMFFLSIFAFSTIPCSCYYGWRAVDYLFKDKKIFEVLYKMIYLTFVFIGSNMNIDEVFRLASIANIGLMIPNIYMIFALRKEIK